MANNDQKSKKLVGPPPPSSTDSSWIDTANDDTFFTKYKIDGKRWDKVFPYRLVVVDVSDGKYRIVRGSNSTVGSDFKVSSYPMYNGFSFALTNTNSPLWVFTLPITPQQLSIQDLYAINGTATARGVSEEHNGVKFKIITAQGTMGVRPSRPTIGMESGVSSADTIFSGTLESASKISETIRDFKKIAEKKSNEESSLSESELQKTGYYQAMLMGQFLERYTEAKKNPDHKNWRLCFDIPKQNKTFIVIPEVFSLKQNYMRPNQMLWDIKLRAYARIVINSSPSEVKSNIKIVQLKDYQKALGSIGQARKLMSNSISLIKAVRSDFKKPFEALRQTALLVKDLAGLVNTVADLPKSIIQDLIESIVDSFNIIKSAVSSKSSNSDLNSAVTQEDKTLIISGIMIAKSKDSEGGNIKLSSDKTDPINLIKTNTEEYFGFFDSIDIGSIDKTPEQKQAIADEQSKTAFINIDTLNAHKATILDLHSAIVNNKGLGDATYSNIYNKPLPKTTTTEFTLDDLELLQALINAIQAIDELTASNFLDNTKKVDSLEYISSLANDAGIEFTLPKGKKLVPVPFGLTIEEISARYLKDPNRWMELLAINNLRSPYIDEDGFTYNLLSNGEGRQFSTDDVNGSLFVGQKITLKSNTVPAFVRKIDSIEKIGDGNFLVTVDGDADLSKLKVSENANMQAYLPGTTNSQNRIFIPTDEQINDDDGSFSIPSLENTQINKLAKVDWLLDDKGDIAINSIGEVRLSTGMTNLIQAAKLKILTRKNTLLSHLDYGMSTRVGASLADVDNGKLAAEINNLFARDPRFEGIDKAEVILEGSVLSINLIIKLTGGNGVVPIGFQIN